MWHKYTSKVNFWFHLLMKSLLEASGIIPDLVFLIPNHLLAGHSSDTDSDSFSWLFGQFYTVESALLSCCCPIKAIYRFQTSKTKFVSKVYASLVAYIKLVDTASVTQHVFIWPSGEPHCFMFMIHFPFSQ